MPLGLRWVYLLRLHSYYPVSYPALCCVYKIRQVAEYIDYTSHHLPENKPELPKNDEATFASFAARIALSNLDTRSLARYGVRAFSKFRWLLSMLFCPIKPAIF